MVKFEFLTLNGSPPPHYPKSWELTAYEPATPLPAAARPRPPVPIVASPPPAQASKPPAASEPIHTAAASAPPVAEPTKRVAPVVVPSSLDGAWQMDLQVTTTYGFSSGGECQTRANIPLTFVNGNAQGLSANLHLTEDGGISGWMKVPFLGQSIMPFIVKVSGRLDGGVFIGSVSGRCEGRFTMRKQ